MTGRRVVPLLLAASAVAVLVVVLLRGSDPYELKLGLSSANGLRSGSDVRVGGVTVGSVDSIDLREGDRVEATLHLDRDKVDAVRSDARAEIVTGNLLGSKYLVLHPGRRGRALPQSTARIPEERVTSPTDLDQVLSVLDDDTRARFTVLVNELGLAVTGRKADFRRTLELLPMDLERAHALVAEVASDNRTLADLVRTSSGYVRAITRERKALVDAIDGLGRTLDITAAKRRELRATFAAAPATVRDARRFLADLEATTAPLQPAARAITRTAPALTGTLAQLRPFERAAKPALDRAVAVAPQLTGLAADATPVLREARPTLRSLATASKALAPVSRVLDVSIDDVLGVVEGWARAIQGRDALGHMFRGRVTVTAENMRTLIASLNADDREPTAPRRRARKDEQRAPDRGRGPERPKRLDDRLKDLPKLLDELPETLEKLLPEGLRPKELLPGAGRLLDGGAPDRGGAPSERKDPTMPLLDFLLGG